MRFRLYLNDEDTPIIQGVCRENYHSLAARDVQPVSREVIVYEEGTGVRGYVSLGQAHEDFPRAALYDSRLNRWQVFPPAMNDDYQQMVKPGA